MNIMFTGTPFLLDGLKILKTAVNEIVFGQFQGQFLTLLSCMSGSQRVKLLKIDKKKRKMSYGKEIRNRNFINKSMILTAAKSSELISNSSTSTGKGSVSFKL